MSIEPETSFLNFANKMLSESAMNKEFLTVKMLLDDPSCPFSEKALRFHIGKSGVNGLAPEIFRIGKKFLIKKSLWIIWLENHAQQKKGKGKREIEK